MLAEKAALLGRDGEEPEDDVQDTRAKRPKITSPVSPTKTTEIAETIRPETPGDAEIDPLTIQSPTAEIVEPVLGSQSLSEKARGKMRATESVTSLSATDGQGGDVPDEELMKVAAAGVGPNGYVPTQEWVSSWQKGLPLDPVLVAISELLPKIQDSQTRVGAPSSKVFNLLKGASLVEVLPPPQPIMPRRFQVRIIGYGRSVAELFSGRLLQRYG